MSIDKTIELIESLPSGYLLQGNLASINTDDLKALASAVKELTAKVEESSEPYMGWCDVEGCEREASSGGSHWRETGYWSICMKHGDDARGCKQQPTMKQKAVCRESSRDPVTGYLPPYKPEEL